MLLILLKILKLLGTFKNVVLTLELINILHCNMESFFSIIEKHILKREDINNSNYFNELKLDCKNILEKLKKMEINYSQAQRLNELIKENKLIDRINSLCLGDSINTNKILENIKNDINKYINYYSKLAILIRYYNYYFSKSKENEINEYKKVQKILVKQK